MDLYHMDKRTNEALSKLSEMLAKWKFNTERGSTLILIPEYPDEKIVFLLNGELLTDGLIMPSELLEAVLKQREEREQKRQK